MAANYLLSLYMLKDLPAAMDSAPHDALAIFLVAFSVVFGDLFSGVFHWSVDNYGNGKTPVLGPVIEAFQGHHGAPWTITYRPFANNVHKICKATIGLMLLTLVAHPSVYVQSFMVLFLNSQILSQEFHKYSHMTQPPAIMAKLQETGLVLSRKAHGAHHSSPFEGNYCILTGWWNELLDSSNFFRKLEKVVYQVTGEEPNCWKLDPELKKMVLETM